MLGKIVKTFKKIRYETIFDFITFNSNHLMILVSTILPKLPLYSSNQNFVFTFNIIYIFMHDFLWKYLIACNAFLVLIQTNSIINKNYLHYFVICIIWQPANRVEKVNYALVWKFLYIMVTGSEGKYSKIYFF